MLERSYQHLSRCSGFYLWLLVAFIALGRHFIVTLNVSASLPGSVFLIQKGVKPEKGNLAAFRYSGGGPYMPGVLFLKRLVGEAGSLVSAHAGLGGYREYFVDGHSVGYAKPFSRDGMPLPPGPVGVIAAGHYYMAAPHPDSLDSRYAWVGWVSDAQIVGRAWTVF